MKMAEKLLFISLVILSLGLVSAASFPTPFVQSGESNVAIIIGEDAPLSDAVVATNIGSMLATELAAQRSALGLSNEGDNLGSVTFYYAEMAGTSGRYLIAVGGNCVNPFVADLFGKGSCGASDYNTLPQISEGQFIIQAFDFNGHLALAVVGATPEDTQAASDYLVNNAISTNIGDFYVGGTAIASQPSSSGGGGGGGGGGSGESSTNPQEGNQQTNQNTIINNNNIVINNGAAQINAVDSEEEAEPEEEEACEVSECELEDSCVSIGYRHNGTYCSMGGSFKPQGKESYCDNNFECESNLCANNECVSGGLIESIISWFKSLFGF